MLSNRHDSHDSVLSGEGGEASADLRVLGQTRWEHVREGGLADLVPETPDVRVQPPAGLLEHEPAEKAYDIAHRRPPWSFLTDRGSRM